MKNTRLVLALKDSEVLSCAFWNEIFGGERNYVILLIELKIRYTGTGGSARQQDNKLLEGGQRICSMEPNMCPECDRIDIFTVCLTSVVGFVFIWLSWNGSAVLCFRLSGKHVVNIFLTSEWVRGQSLRGGHIFMKPCISGGLAVHTKNYHN